MALAFGFSAGDIITGITLVKGLITAIQDSKGSSKEYLELISELRGLESALLEVKKLPFRSEQHQQQAVLGEAVVRCRTCIDDFLTTMTKYHSHLRLDGSQRPWQDALRKIQWRLSKKEDIERFRSAIAFHTQTLQISLITTQLHSTSLQDPTLRDQTPSIFLGNDRLQDMQPYSQQLIMTAQKSLRILEVIHSNLPPQIMQQQPVIFRDALDRVAPIHLEWINSWEAFLAVLKVRFKERGLRKVENMEFALQRAGSRRDIKMAESWEVAFCPGQEVNMSIIFHQTGYAANSLCPSCRYECFGDAGSEIKCPNCEITFSRAREVPEVSDPTAAQAFLENLPFSVKLNRNEKKRKPRSFNEGEENAHDFRRVRILHEPELKLPQESDRDRPVTLEVALEVENTFAAKAQSKQHTYTIQCICQHPERGITFTVHCHRCDTWQHASCYTACFGRIVRPHACIHCKTPELAISRVLVQKRHFHVYTIKCICGFPDDDIDTLYCEACNTWYHSACYNFGSEYQCLDCYPRLFDYTRARIRWQSLLESTTSFHMTD